MLLVAVGTALALMVLIVITTARNAPILHSPNRNPNLHVRYGSYTPPKMPTGGPLGQRTPNNGMQHLATSIGNIVLAVILIALLLAMAWLLAIATVSLIRRLRTQRRVRRAGELPDTDDAVLDAVTQATGRQQQLLQEGTPSNAVVACWVDLEQAVAAVGVARRPSETSAELTIRVLDALDVDRRALRTLAVLYREARFSAHPLTEQHRQSALEAVYALHRSLPAVKQEQV